MGETVTKPEAAVVEVHVSVFQAFRKSFLRLTKKAAKTGSPVPTFVEHGRVTRSRETESGHNVDEVFVRVSVEGEAPKLPGGWSLVAVIEPTDAGNFVRTVPGRECPEQFRTTAPVCDHCQKTRRRKETFVVVNDAGEYKQVGRQCLADFLGGQSPEDVLAWWSMFYKAVDELNAVGADRDYYGQTRGPVEYHLESFLAITACVIRKLGWVSRTQVIEQQEGIATVGWVERILRPSGDPGIKQLIEQYDLHASERDTTEAKAAIAWALTLADAGEPLNDYRYNVNLIARSGLVTARQAGIAASILPAYFKAVEKATEAARAREAKKREHVGTIGTRQGFADLVVVGQHSFDSDYGVRTLLRFEDKEGNLLVWWTGEVSEEFDTGNTLDLTATVKEHGDYKGTKQTIITRAKIGLPPVKKERKVKV